MQGVRAFPTARFAALAAAAVALVAGSALLGYPRLGLSDIFGEAPNYGFWRVRVPRVGVAALVGAGLSLGGVVFQALFRNPLATPYTLGIASGAALAAAGGFLAGWHGAVLGVPTPGLLAFGGATGAMGLVYAMARLRAGSEMTHLLLAGVCVSYAASAGVLLILYLANVAVTNDIVIWLMGALGHHRPRLRLELLAVLLPALAYVVYSHRALDLLAMGELLAASRGVDVRRTVWTCYALVGALTAVIVGACGPIGFVGLMVPHMARALVGVRTLPLTLASVLLGAAFLAVCDGVARLPRSELPVGVITNLTGSAFFFYLLATRDVAYGEPRGR